MTQLLMDNAFCMFYSRTQVACSKPLTGNYGQQASDRHNEGAPDKSPHPVAPSPSTIPSMACSNLAAFSEAVRRNPNDAGAYVDRANCYLRPGPNNMKPPLMNTEAAIKDLEVALRLEPRNWTAHHDYAHTAYLMDYDNLAVFEFNKAISLNPRSARSYLGRGFAYLKTCDFTAAARDFQQAVNLDPSLRNRVATQQDIDYDRQVCTGKPVAGRRFEESVSEGQMTTEMFTAYMDALAAFCDANVAFSE